MNIIILAGGRGSRMGFVDKAAVRVDGKTLLSLMLQEIPEEDTVVIVSPNEISGLATVSENPPLGGPVAGIEAGVLTAGQSAEFTAILAVDAPYSARMLPLLNAAIGSNDVAVTIAADGWRQPLCALWRSTALVSALAALGETRNKPAKALVKMARSVIEVPGTGDEADYDTVMELHALGEVELP